ncbi:hypothetical protein RvY_03096 [Ramazzottius varieornatus]|uniref:Uncharacterized protein n=1 Tax=Ramazzottius varieornatus TaxID=947166 RepID=A0A1D1UX32_RAMVA|nr:hypothetical protein RvY_03096 [Ramazzottius varieornatus]
MVVESQLLLQLCQVTQHGECRDGSPDSANAAPSAREKGIIKESRKICRFPKVGGVLQLIAEKTSSVPFTVCSLRLILQSRFAPRDSD